MYNYTKPKIKEARKMDTVPCHECGTMTNKPEGIRECDAKYLLCRSCTGIKMSYEWMEDDHEPI